MTGPERVSIERLEDKIDRRFDEVLEAFKIHAANDREDFGKLDDRIRGIELHGSANAIEALAETHELRTTVARLSGRISWATGAIAAVVLLVNVGIRFIPTS